ncbi:Ig-like domain repeat protein, partial [Rhodoblastus sp. 17X3]|uniref:Ig-like domain repeat protein n=1 Tax=Rhodoblastus sp. 17X3 TaxID=3047026 RepID=UPI0024B663B1
AGSLAGGVATFSTSALTTGNHTITASYAGDGNFNGGTGSLAGNPQVVNKGNVSTTLTASQNPAGLGQSVTLTVTIAAISPATGTPTGAVTFLDGGAAIGTGALTGGTASLTTSSLAVGNHTITISYGGDGKFNAGTGSLAGNPLVVGKGAATVGVTSSLPSASSGQTVTFTATVSAVAPASGTPTGAVTFLDGGAPIGAGSLAGGIATISTAALAPGSHTITASYAGDSNFGAAAGALSGSQVVNQGGSQVAVVANPSPATAGKSVTLTATVTASGGAVGLPTGTVAFTDGATSLGAAALSGGVATLVIPSFTAGAHTITATYAGNANFVASTGSVVETVNKAGSSVTLNVNGSATIGQAVPIRANITPATATGAVTFFDNGAPIGAGAVSGGAASITAAALAVGAHSITASYSGDSNNTAATAAAATVMVGKATPAIALATSSATPLFGTAVTLTATVSGGQSPTGSVVFKDGANVLGSAPLAGGTARFSTSSLSVGAHSVVAVYGGDVNNASVSASTSVNVNARPDPTANGDVKGLIEAQVNMAARYGETQIGNTFRRLEQLHDEEDEESAAQQQSSAPSSHPSSRGGGFGGGNAFGGSGFAGGAWGDGRASGAGGGFGGTGFGGGAMAFGSIANPSSALAYAETVNVPQRQLQSDTALAVQSLSAALPAAFQALDKTGALPVHVWATGAFSLGQIRSDNSVDNHFSSSGVTVGFDGKVLDRVKAGVAVGLGFDNTSVGVQGSASNATAYSATLYSSVKLAHSTFLDFIAGYGALRFDTRRWSDDGGLMLGGVRNGDEAYGSVSLTQDFRWDGLKISPYGRLDAVRLFLDGYRETGSNIWALSYDPLNETTLSGVLGARVVYSLPMSWGILTPGGRVEYTHAFQGGYVQNLNYADLVGIAPGYSTAGAAMARDALSLGLSIRAVTQGATSLELEYMVSTAGRQFEGQQLRASARQAF